MPRLASLKLRQKVLLQCYSSKRRGGVMGRRGRQQIRYSASLGMVGLSGYLLFGSASYAQTEIIPDNTLGAESAEVAQGNDLILIGGGAQRANNLFQSFRVFNLGRDHSAFFVNPRGVTHILTRVTGGNASTIDGRLGVLGNANLFFLNPSGIIFGPNASLSISGSFIASTANQIEFGEVGNFSASSQLESPLLSITPSALFFTAQPQPIINRSLIGLNVRTGRSVILAGGEIRFEGGAVNAPGGRIELGAIAQPGTLGLSQQNNLWQLSVPATLQRSNITFLDQAAANASSADGGGIALYTHHLTLQNSSLSSGIGLPGSDQGQAGDIKIQATGDVQLKDGSVIRNGIGLGSIGNSGNIFVQARSLSLEGESGIQNITLGRGNAGNIQIQTPSLTLKDRSTISAGTLGQGNAGNITLAIEQAITLENNSSIVGSVARGARGQGGEVVITTGSLNLLSGSQVDVSTAGIGDAGQVKITATEQITIRGVANDAASQILSIVEDTGQGNGGLIQLEAPVVQLTEGGLITSFTLGDGRAGDVSIQADAITIDGGMDQFQSGIATFSGLSATGDAGNIEIQAGQLTLSNGGILEALTQSAGKAGDIRLTIHDRLAIRGEGSGIFASTTVESSGESGNIIISAPEMSVTEAARVSVDSDGSGNGGNLSLQTGTLRLDQGALTASTASGEGGNITITADNRIVMTNNSLIAAESTGSGNGGNIQISTPFLIAAGNSDITASALAGNGGNIQISADGIFGLQARPRLTPSNDITASSEFGIDGEVTINNTLDPSSGLVRLPSDLVDLTNLVGQRCRGGQPGSSPSQFYLTGRGGLPPTPGDPLHTPFLLRNIADPLPDANSSTKAAAPSRLDAPVPYIEAQGWRRNEKGQVVLTAPVAIATSNWQPSSPECPQS